DMVGGVEVVATADNDEHRGDCVFAIQRMYQADEGHQGFAVAVDEFLHPFVPDHQIGGGGVLVHQQSAGAGLHRFADVGGLRGGAGSVVGAEVTGVGRSEERRVGKACK